MGKEDTKIAETLKAALDEVIRPATGNRTFAIILLNALFARLGTAGEAPGADLTRDLLGTLALDGDEEAALAQDLRRASSARHLEAQRLLAREAVQRVNAETLQFPRMSVLGRIFRGGEFEEPGMPMWSLWVQMLAGVCNKDLKGDYNPAFPSILAQMSDDEAKLLPIMRRHRREYSEIEKVRAKPEMLTLINGEIQKTLEQSDGWTLMRYLDHFVSLGLIYFIGYQPGDDESVFYVLSNEYVEGHIGITGFGLNFMKFALSPDAPAEVGQSSSI